MIDKHNALIDVMRALVRVHQKDHEQLRIMLVLSVVNAALLAVLVWRML